MNSPGSRRSLDRVLLPVALAVAASIGIAVRLWHVAGEPLWLDEAYSAFAADRDFGFLWRVVPLYETHPPFYYSLLRLWTLVFGDGLVALRALGLAAGLLTPPMIGWAGDATGALLGWTAARRRWLAATAFVLACVAVALVEMAREVRPYPLMILAYAGAIRALLGVARQARQGRPIAGWAFAAYLILTELMLWLHNLGPLWAASMALALLATIAGRSLRRADWLAIAAGYAVVALAYLPCFLILLGQAPTWIASTWVRFDPADVIPRLLLLYAVPGLWAWTAIPPASIAAGRLIADDPGRRLLAALAILALLPVLLSIGLTLAVAPVFITRTLTPVAVPALLLIATGATAGRGTGRILGAGTALILAANMLAIDIQARRGGPMQNWYGTVAWLRARARPGDVIYAYPNEGALPLARALRDQGVVIPIRQVPADMPALGIPGGWNPTGSRGVVSIPRAALRAIAQAPATRAVPTVWLLRLGANAYDVGDVAAKEFAWHRHLVRRWRSGPIDIIGLRRDDLPRDLPFYSGAASSTAPATSRK